MSSPYPKEKTSELACVFAALLLHDEKIPIEADKIKAIITAAGVDVEPYWPSVFAKFLNGKNVSDMLVNIGGSAAPAAAASTGGAAPAEEAKEEKKKVESSSEEEDDDAFGGLF